MMRVPDTHPVLDKVFALSSPGGMLSKLHWEIHNLEHVLLNPPAKIGHVHAPSYCAFNCAVTSWHMADWIFEATDTANRHDLFVGEQPPTKIGLTAFQTYVRRRSRAVHICQQIATSSKHMVMRSNPDPTIRTDLRWISEPARYGEARMGDPLVRRSFELIVEDLERGTRVPVLNVFNDAFRYWDRFLGAHCGGVE